MEPRETTGERLLAELLGARNNNQSTVTLNAGGVGVWIAGTCCLVMLAALLVGAFWISGEFDRINSRFNDQTDVDSVQDAYIHKLRAEQPKKEKP
jgi:hypothetical protein